MILENERDNSLWWDAKRNRFVFVNSSQAANYDVLITKIEPESTQESMNLAIQAAIRHYEQIFAPVEHRTAVVNTLNLLKDCFAGTSYERLILHYFSSSRSRRNNGNHSSRFLMKAPFFGYWITGDEPCGYGTEYMRLSLREVNEKGQPGKRIKTERLNRSKLIDMAFNLLDMADMMQPNSTYATSDGVHSSKSEELPINATFNKLRYEPRVFSDQEVIQRKREVAQRFERLRQRMPILQLAQRVLEGCKENVAATLYALLVTAEQTGDLPFMAGLHVMPFSDVDGYEDVIKN